MNIFSRRGRDAETDADPLAGGVFEGLFDWMGSPEGSLFEQIRDVTWADLEAVTLDPEARTLTWPDGAVLGIGESAQRIFDDIEPGQGFTREAIEAEIVAWLEMGYAPTEPLTPAQQTVMERRINAWIKAHWKERRRRSRG